MCNLEVEGRANLPLFIHECIKRLDQVFFIGMISSFALFLSFRRTGETNWKRCFVRVYIFLEIVFIAEDSE